MGLNKADGNMYTWVSHTHTHLAGECSHRCSYCSTVRLARQRPAVAAKYSGEYRIAAAELDVRYGSPAAYRYAAERGLARPRVFVEHMTDLFADTVPCWLISDVLDHIRKWPDCEFVLQTKNPRRLAYRGCELPPPVDGVSLFLGTTIETNRRWPQIMGNCPAFEDRVKSMVNIREWMPSATRFITIEPVMEFDLDAMMQAVKAIAPAFVNVGAVTGNIPLPEPGAAEVLALIAAIRAAGVEVREKGNLRRITG